MYFENKDDDQDNQKLTLDAEMNKLAKETLDNFDFMRETFLIFDFFNRHYASHINHLRTLYQYGSLSNSNQNELDKLLQKFNLRFISKFKSKNFAINEEINDYSIYISFYSKLIETIKNCYYYLVLTNNVVNIIVLSSENLRYLEILDISDVFPFITRKIIYEYNYNDILQYELNRIFSRFNEININYSNYSYTDIKRIFKEELLNFIDSDTKITKNLFWKTIVNYKEENNDNSIQKSYENLLDFKNSYENISKKQKWLWELFMVIQIQNLFKTKFENIKLNKPHQPNDLKKFIETKSFEIKSQTSLKKIYELNNSKLYFLLIWMIDNFHYIFYQRDFIISSEKKIIDFNNSIPIGLMQILMEQKKDSPLDTLTLYFTIIDCFYNEFSILSHLASIKLIQNFYNIQRKEVDTDDYEKKLLLFLKEFIYNFYKEPQVSDSPIIDDSSSEIISIQIKLKNIPIRSEFNQKDQLVDFKEFLLIIEYIKNKDCIIIKLKSDLFMNIDNGDEGIYVSQKFNNSIKGLSVEIEENRKFTFKITICRGYRSNLFYDLIEAIDEITIIGAYYYSYWIKNINQSRPTKDEEKFNIITEYLKLILKEKKKKFEENFKIIIDEIKKKFNEFNEKNFIPIFKI